MMRLPEILFIALSLLLVGCSKQGLELTEKEYGKDWPLTVSSGRVECKNNLVIFHASGREYGVNGMAKSKGYTPIDIIWKYDPKFFRMVEEVQEAKGISYEDALKIMGEPTKINIGPILDSGLKLCK